MSRRRADSQGSLGPDDEVMPYSDDETDDELDASSEGEEPQEEPPGAPHVPVEARPSGESLCSLFFVHMFFNFFVLLFYAIPFVSNLSQSPLRK